MHEKELYTIEIENFKKLNARDASRKPRMDSIRTVCASWPVKEFIITPASWYSTKFPFVGKIMLRFKLFKYLYRLDCFIQIKKILSNIRNSVVFVQYPLYNTDNETFLRKLKNNDNHVILLVHDAECLRSSKSAEKEIRVLSVADVCILHSEQMISKLRQMGLSSPAVSLEFFDYCLDGKTSHAVNWDSLKKIQMVFAGNLSKSAFVAKLNQLELDKDFRINLYGGACPNGCESDFMHYKGSFLPDDIESMEGNWGLVWDGDRLEGCGHRTGDYLKYNAPFKLSLYLAAGIPVIVWKKSAVATYVEKYHLGICVDSLNEIPSRINKLDDKEVALIAENVNSTSLALRNGQKLHKAFQDALTLLNLSK